MENIVRLLNKPEYLLRPQQMLSRILFAWKRPGEIVDVRLPWGLTIGVRPGDEIGRAVCTYGLYDLVTTETIARLLDPGETALDIGANIGYMTGLMAWRSGPMGRVHCFETCAQVFRDLSANTRWAADQGLAPVTIHQIALSRSAGNADLHIPASFGANRGTASLEVVPSDGPSVRVERIKVARLDDILGDKDQVGLAKIDGEGHELAVLEGAAAVAAEFATSFSKSTESIPRRCKACFNPTVTLFTVSRGASRSPSYCWPAIRIYRMNIPSESFQISGRR